MAIKNLDEELAAGNLPFNETEKNAAAFKGLYQILNSSAFKSNFSNEQFAKSYLVFPDDIISEAKTILQSPNSAEIVNVKPALTRIWLNNQDLIDTDITSSLVRGNFIDSPIPSHEEFNPNVEYIECPLVKVKGTTNQLYAAYGKTGISTSESESFFSYNAQYKAFEVDGGNLFTSQSHIFKNFISPFKFGLNYTVKIYQSNETLDGVGTEIFETKTSKDQFGGDAANTQHGGWVFDYKEGFLSFGVQTNEGFFDGEKGDEPDLSGYNHPLWIRAYRYNGQTGSAATDGAGITEINNTTNVTPEGFNFSSETLDLSLGNSSVNLAGLGTSFEHLVFKNDFSRYDIQFSSSIAIMHDADANGAPYVKNDYESWLMLHTIHLTDPNKNDFASQDSTIAPEFQNGAPIIQFPYGFAVEFSSSLSPSKCPYFPNKHYEPIKETSGDSTSTSFSDVTDGQYQEHRAHTHGFNWGYVTQSNGNNFYYDPSNKTSGSIAEGLRDFINTSCSAHLTASVSIETSVNGNTNVPILTVEQLYSGMPSWYYTNTNGGFRGDYNSGPDILTPSSFKNYTGTFRTSSANANGKTTAFGASIYPLRFTASNASENYNDYIRSNTTYLSQHTPQTGSEEQGDQLIEFQKSLFHLDEKLNTGSAGTPNFFNSISGSFINLFCGDFPDGLFELNNLTPLANYLEGTSWEHSQQSIGGAYFFGQYLPSLIIGNSSVSNPNHKEGGPANFRVGSRANHPFGGMGNISSNQAATHGWGSSPYSVTFSTHNGLVQVQFGGILVPTTLPTGSDSRFGQINNVLLKNGIFSQRNPSRRSIIRAYQLEMLRGGFGGAQFGLVDFVANNQHAVLQLNTGINSLSGEVIGGGKPVNSDFRNTGNTGRNGLNFMWSSSISIVTTTVGGEEINESVNNEGDFASMNTVEFRVGQANSSPSEIEIISDNNPSLGGNLNLNAQTINGFGNIDISGDINADNISSNTLSIDGITFEAVETSTLTGSNEFGNSSDDTQFFFGNITASSNISASGNIIATNISASGHVTASELHIGGATFTSASLASSGEGAGFPFSGSAVLTGSLHISSSDPFIQLDSSLTNLGAGKLHNRDGALYWGNTNVATVGSGITAISQDENPSLGGDLTAGFDISSSAVKGHHFTGNAGAYVNINGDSIIFQGSKITQLGTGASTQLQATQITGSLNVYGDISASKAQLQNTGITGSLRVEGNVSASGNLTANLTEITTVNSFKPVVLDTATGQLYHTASLGGGGTGTGFPFTGTATINGQLTINGGVDSDFIQIPINNQTNNDFITVSFEGGAPFGSLHNEYNMFDNDNDTYHHFYGFPDLDTTTTHIDFNFFDSQGYSPIITKIHIKFFGNGKHKQIEILGSNGGEFTSIYEEPSPTDEGDRDIIFTNTNTYKNYRLKFKPGQYNEDDTFTIAEIKYYGYTTSNGLLTTSNIEATSITGSLLGTSSQAISASYAFQATSASQAISSSYAISSSHAIFALSSSYASPTLTLTDGSTTVNSVDQITFNGATLANSSNGNTTLTIDSQGDQLWYNGINFLSSSVPIIIPDFIRVDKTTLSSLGLEIANSRSLINKGDILQISSEPYRRVDIDFGAPVFTVLNGGNVGIGNVNPNKKLIVAGTISGSGELYIERIPEAPLGLETFPLVYGKKHGQFFITSSDAFSGTTSNPFSTNGSGIISSSEQITGSLNVGLNSISADTFNTNNIVVTSNINNTTGTINSNTGNITSINSTTITNSNNITSIRGNFNNLTSSLITSSDVITTNLSASNIITTDISASGGISASNLHVNGNVETETFTINGLNFVASETTTISGSTAFGTVASASNSNTSLGFFTVKDITHQFTGSVSITGSLDVDGKLNATASHAISASYVKNGDNLGNHKATENLLLQGNDILNANIISGSLLGIENILGGNKESANKILEVTGDNLNIGFGTGYTSLNIGHSKSQIKILNHITASGDISASGNLYADLPESNLNTIVTYDTSSGKLLHYNLSDFNVNDPEGLTVSPINVPYSSSLEELKVQRDGGEISTNNPGSTTDNDIAGNSGSLIDGIENLPYDYFKIYPKGSGTVQDAANIIFYFKTPVIISEFRQRFYNDGSTTYLPKNVLIYGKNTEFEAGADDGTLLAQGVRPSTAAIYDQNPYGDGTVSFTGGEFANTGNFIQANQRRTSSIAETSLTSSFQYYRIRYSGSLSLDKRGKELGIILQEITPVTRSFTQGSTTSFNNGVIDSEQVVTNNLIGTASHAIFAETTNNATNGFPFSGSAVISGSLSISGGIDFDNLSLHGNLNLNNNSIENVNNIDALSANIGYLESNQIVTTTLNTNTIEVGTLPSSTEPSGGISTTGPITVTSIITSSTTQNYDNFEILSVQKRQGLTGVYWDNIHGAGGKLKLTSSNFAFTSGSTQSLVDTQTDTSIIVNQNTLGTYSVPSPGVGPYPLYPNSTNDLAVETHQTNSFFVKYKFSEPVLIDNFKINFLSQGGTIVGYDYLENSMSLDGTQIFTNAKNQEDSLNIGDYVIDRIDDTNSIVDLYGFDPINDNINVTPASFWGDSNHWFKSNKLGILVDDHNFNFLYEGTIDSPFSPSTDLASFTEGSGLAVNHRGVVFGRIGGSSIPPLNLSDPEAGLHIGYDFGEGNETIIHKYQIHQYKNHMITDMVFEACNDTSSGDWTLIDVNMNITTYENVVNGLYTTIQTFNPQNSLQPITTRDNSNFQNTTPFRFYRFRFLGGETSFFKIGFFQANEITEGAAAGFNPEYVSIYSNQEGEGDQGTDTIYTPFAYYPGTFKGTTKITSTDITKIISLEEFNSTNGNPLSQYYTIEFSGSHNPNNFAGVAEIQPVTRSFTTQLLTFGPDIHYPNLPEGHPNNINCDNASVVYYNTETGTFYHTSSCNDTVDATTTTTIFDTIQVDTITEKTPTNGIIFDSSIKFNPSTISDNNQAKRPLLTFDESTGEIFKSRNTFDGNTQTELDGDIQIKGDMSLTGSFDAHRAIIGISGSDKRGFNNEKLTYYFDYPNSRYSLYVRNGDTIVGGNIIPDTPLKYDIGSKTFPFKDLHLKRGSIHFYSGSSETSGSSKDEIASIGVNEKTKVIEFKSGSEFRPIQVKEINIGSEVSGSSPTSSVQISGEGQGFVAVHAEAGKHSTIFRAESPVLTGDLKMGSITQKGSGSFAILLDADQVRNEDGVGAAKFVVESNNPIPGVGTRLLSVSESGETRAYNHLKVDTNITASGNISASGDIIARILHGTFFGAISSSAQFNNSDNVLFNHITASGNISSSGNITANQIIIGGETFTSASLAAASVGNGGVNDYTQLSNIPSGIISGSPQIATEISGAFSGFITSHSIGSGQYTSSLQILTNITSSGNISASGTIIGSNLTNVENIALSTYTGDGGALNNQYIINGKNFSTITQLNASSSTLQTNINEKATTGSNVLFAHITASANISASGNIIGNTLIGTIDGGSF